MLIVFEEEKFDKEKRGKVWSNRDKMTDFLIASLFYPKLIRFIWNRSRIYEWRVPFPACWLSLRKNRKAECAGSSLKLLSARIKSVDRESKNWERFKSASEMEGNEEKVRTPKLSFKSRRWKGDMNEKSGNPFDLATLLSPLPLLFASNLIPRILSFLYLFLIFFSLFPLSAFLSIHFIHRLLCFIPSLFFHLLHLHFNSIKRFILSQNHCFRFLLFFRSLYFRLAFFFPPHFLSLFFNLHRVSYIFLRSLFFHPCPFFYREASRRRSDIVEVL